MSYIKVLWIHHKNDYPIVMFSELSEDRYETRKVELFANGTMTYAKEASSNGVTQLGEVAVPSLEDIASDPEFNPVEITKTEFEEIWDKATAVSN
jgi:hypothetical protein